MRRTSDPRNRVAVGFIDKDDTAIGIMEWELGSRVTGDLIAENEAIIGEPTLRTRIALAMPNAPKPKATWIQNLEVQADSYIEMFVTLEHETEEVYLCEDTVEERGIPKLCLVQLYPEIDDEKKRNWIVDVDLVEFACEHYEDVVKMRAAANNDIIDGEVVDANSDAH